MTRKIRRGDIFTVDFEPARGSEQGKRRPALVLQNDIGNRHSPTIIVAAIKTGDHTRFPTNVTIKASEGGLRNNSIILLNQILTIDKSRLGRYWGHAAPKTMQKVNKAIKISLGLVPI
ncbi:MAG: type II toxin-antitoxin system PemK/MazF family toxin [Chloroflexi bacterium]|nr:type II toxin-antitoxin system PemK/MazF family toxin [Chloroflexota bacterium]